MTATSSPAADGRLRLQDIRRRLESPVAPYYLILGSTAMLLCFGLIMVLSASSVTSYQDSGSSFTVFKNQLTFAVLGTVVAVIASRIPTRWWKIVAFPVFGAAICLQLLVFTGLGRTVNGNRNWISLGGFSVQPSEFGKIAVVLACALVLAHKRAVLHRLRHVIFPLVPLLVTLFVLVMLGHDLGTTMVLALIAAGVFFVAGVRMRVFLAAGVLAVGGAIAAVVTSGNRTGRIDAWLGTCINAHTPGCYQKMHGMYAMADGGWWGVGLGAGREKWSWLPEAHNDFIFAVIGEELGLPGTIVVLGLYAALGYGCYRMIVTSSNMFVRLATAGIMVWILAQSMINIGSVIGMLPIIGVPLPLVSSGGSALVTTLLALGILISFARNEPECKAALAARPSLVRRTMTVLPFTKGSR